MQSFENGPTSSPSRRTGASGITVNTTGYKTKSRDANISPPRTPQATGSRKGNGSAAAWALKSTPRETFLDDITPVDFSRDPGYRDGAERHSHDLSLAPEQITRDSLVDNMLLSLDQLTFGHDSGAFGSVQGIRADDMRYEDESNSSTYSPQLINSRPNHVHSFSSDYENHDSASRASSQYTRTRRSHSSSNFATSSGRINHGNTGGSIGTQRPQQNQGVHSQERKGSKGSCSSTNSFDLGYAQVTSNQRWAQGFGGRGRSSSFDYGHDTHITNFQRQQAHTPTDIERYDGYEAAPTPTVPVGPRRQRPLSPAAPFTAETGSQSPKTHTIERKRSTRSTKSGYTRRAETSHGQGATMNNQLDSNRNLPSLPAFKREDTPPVSLAAYAKPKEAPPVQTIAPKPGFFRRVFGSKNNLAAAAAGPASSQGSASSVENLERPGSNKYPNSERVKTSHGHPSPQPRVLPKEQPHVVTKKPSSFFRRRKKSITEPEMPPLPPPLHERGVSIRDITSPTSSLRQVMNPYLNTPIKQTTPQTGYDSHSRYLSDSTDEEAQDVNGFSPGYTPDKNATIRSVSHSRGGGTPGSVTLPRSGLSQQSHLGSDHVEGSDRTFLQDSSDTDREGCKIVSQTLTVKKDTSGKDAPNSPNAVARDMALVAQYEQKYSKRALVKKPENPMLSLYPKSAASPNSAKSVDAAGPIASDNEKILTRASSTISINQKENRLRLDTSAGEKFQTSNLSLPLDGPRTLDSNQSSPAVFYSATSLAINVEGADDTPPESPVIDGTDDSEPPRELDAKLPTVGDRNRAKKIYDGNEDFIQKAKAAAWLGDEDVVKQRTLLAYMELYDFKDLNILAALRALCGRLVLRAETQQVDRILDSFASRWCQCNLNHGFKITDVVHTICYSILLLNTDLHMADIESKMTRSQFVKNTVPTILRVVADAAPDAFDSNRPSILSPRFQTPEPESLGSSGHLGENLPISRDGGRNSADMDKPSWRLSLRPGMPGTIRTNSDGSTLTPLNYTTPSDDCGPLVQAPFHGTLRTWEVQVEIVLKDFYNSIRNERLPLFGAAAEQPRLQQASQSSLTVFASGMLRRTPSIISKAGSESQGYVRGRTADTVRLNTGKWTNNKNRSRPRVYPNSTMGSSRTSLDDQSSIWSPSQSSSTWSKYSLGKTQTSMSVNSVDSNYPQGDYQQSIGFANALSQAIIREEHIGSADSSKSEEMRVAPLLEDESLELAGAPWAKEGILKHKHHLEAADKRAKDRNWAEVFAVIEKGYMSLFSFSTKSTRQKSKSKAAGGVVGGGNWQDNAENLGSFLLRQTIASALPSPGYSKTRPHVFALSLPTGAVHLFQVGTPDIVKEFVSTANYWSARLSNHPLVGGISNIEYGWSDAVINNSLVSAINDVHVAPAANPPGRASISGPRPSLQSSLRSSLDQGTAQFRAKLPGDRITISDWAPPTQSMRASSLMEEDQLRTLEEYVSGIEAELTKHNQLRGAMMLAVSFPPYLFLLHSFTFQDLKENALLRDEVDANDCTVHTARHQLTQSDGELGEEVELPAARDRQVQDVHRLPACGAKPEGKDLRGEGGGPGGERGGMI